METAGMVGAPWKQAEAPSVADLISLAARRVGRAKAAGQGAPLTNRPPRPEQTVTLDAFDRYLEVVASRDSPGSYARIVLPPRTGKTVVAGHIIARSGLSALFVVPTRVLVQQTEEDRAHRHSGL